MSATETAESGSPENKADRADGDTNYPLKVLYCGGNRFFSRNLYVNDVSVIVHVVKHQQIFCLITL